MQRTKIIISFLVIGAAAISFGCGKPGEKSPVLAKINGEVLTVEDFNQQLQGVPAHYRVKFNNLDSKRRLLEGMIREKLLLQAAKKQGLHRNKEIYQKLQKIKEQMLIREVIKTNVIDKAQVGDKEIQRFYELHRENLDKIFKGKGLNEIKKDIGQMVLREKEDRIFELWMSNLKKEAKIVEDIKALKALPISMVAEDKEN